jgi:hypothetical protein
MCAADVLAGTGTLLEAAKGVKIEVEVETGKGGGEELLGTERLLDLRKERTTMGQEGRERGYEIGGEERWKRTSLEWEGRSERGDCR